MTSLNPELVLQYYRLGLFPMARSRKDREVSWVFPPKRAILPLGSLHVSRRFRRQSKSLEWKVTIDRQFSDILNHCADCREESWINSQIREWFLDLHTMGHAHSLEVWEKDHLIGGLYGLAIAGAFFGESMVSLKSGASKYALIHLHTHLLMRGFRLLDCQLYTPFLGAHGVIEMSHEDFLLELQAALEIAPRFSP